MKYLVTKRTDLAVADPRQPEWAIAQPLGNETSGRQGFVMIIFYH
jgi:hypothetical protein